MLCKSNLLHSNLLVFEHYFRDLQLNVKTNKCEVIKLGYNTSHSNYSMNDMMLPRKSDGEDLGVIISDESEIKKNAC